MRGPCLAILLGVVLGVTFSIPAAAQQAPDPERCRQHPEWRQFDFWIGTWDVVRPTPSGGPGGRSGSMPSAMCWITGSTGLLDGAMRFRGITLDPAVDTTFQKLSFHHVATDTVRQVFESSKDGGETWTEDWVGVYIRRSAESGGESTVPGSGVNGECSQMSTEQAIASVRQAYMDAFNKGDAKAVAALHTESSVQMPPGMASVTGRESIRELMEASLSAMPAGVRFEFEATDLRAADGWAVERGVTTASPPFPAGKYVMLYERESDGCWRIAWTITNSDAPPPPR